MLGEVLAMYNHPSEGLRGDGSSSAVIGIL